MFVISDTTKVKFVVLTNGKTFAVREGTFTERDDTYEFEYRPSGAPFGDPYRKTSVRIDFVAAITEDVE